ncbi:mitogen-activated protein kinase kinase kinase 20-like [Rutidosis leptorrhynchoides]|uniref:mitogen-activated protein kinase kinase kinase 20-like n=1 Tax=Rutidosis leptorrhynchoides TaxID=125765 RepID=UPI003A9A046C
MDLEFNNKKRGLLSNNNYEQITKRRNQLQQKDVYDDEDDDVSKYGDGMVWSRGCLIGKGCFGSVFIANLKKPKSKYTSYPPIMAVKSAEVSVSSSIQKEKEVLNNIRGCRNVITCFGEEITNGVNGLMVYNLLLEYGSGGTLSDLIRRQSSLPELDVKRHTRSILIGLRHIHNCGYVHCDLKPENILLVGNSGYDGNKFTAKIGDLGLAKRVKQSKKSKMTSPFCRGTQMYFSPEVVIDGVQEAPSDIWAIGCIVLEMLTGKPPWDSNGDDVLTKISQSNESPFVPETVSNEGRSFLKGCFSRKAMYRWTAEMLLAHPFLEGIGDDDIIDDQNVKEPSDVIDINAITSSIMSENDDDDEISLSSFSDGLIYSSENGLDSWYQEDVDGIEHDVSSCFSVEEISSAAPLNEVHQYPISFTISSGV